MDKEGFRDLLRGRKVPDDKIGPAIALAERYQAYVDASGEQPSAGNASAFSQLLIQEGQNSLDNYMTLARYGLFLKNNDVFVAMLELLDGYEAQPNLYQKVGEMYGEEMRAEIFEGIGIAPIGLPSVEKPGYMHPVLHRLQGKVGDEACKTMLSASLRDLPDAYFQDAKERFEGSKDVDEYLVKKKEAFVAQLEACQNEGRLFFSQEITDEVLAFVRQEPEIGGGVRDGNVIYETKIPYMAKQYLAEANPTLKRYYYCHCPWAREAVKNSDVEFAEIFCYCSGGFHKKPWEVALGQPLEVEVLETVLKGDERCRFAIHLPQEAIS